MNLSRMQESSCSADVKQGDDVCRRTCKFEDDLARRESWQRQMKERDCREEIYCCEFAIDWFPQNDTKFPTER
jgi:hypothetical protein